MVKEEKDIDFYTTGRQPTKKDFERISKWILKNKKDEPKRKTSGRRNNSATSISSAMRY